MKKQSAKPTGRQPVIAGRVPSALHERIKRAAKASGRSMSEELAWRASMSFEWEAAFASMRKSLDEVERGSIEAVLERKGYIRRRDPDTGRKAWFEPGSPVDQQSDWLSPKDDQS